MNRFDKAQLKCPICGAKAELDKKNEITYLRLGYCLDGEYYLISNELY